MSAAFNERTLARWRERPWEFIEECLHDPETDKPFVLFEAQRQFFEHAWKLGDDGRLLYPNQLLSASKKAGKSATAAMHGLTTLILFGGRFAEGLVVANSLEQSQARVLEQMKRIAVSSPLLRDDTEITVRAIKLPTARCAAIAANDLTAAGSEATWVNNDEFHATRGEGARRLFDELSPPPTKKIAVRLITTYACYSGENELLEQLYARGMAQPEVAPSLHAGGGMLMGWYHGAIAPWQTPFWLDQMKASLNEAQYRRLILNEIVVAESEFITSVALDAITDLQLPHGSSDGLICVAGVDASLHNDTSAVIVVGFNPADQSVRLLDHKIFTPSPGKPINFTEIENLLLFWYGKYKLRNVAFDPYQFEPSAQRLRLHYINCTSISPTGSNNNAMTENLLHLIKHRQLQLYPDDAIRQSLLNTIVSEEGGRGLKLARRVKSGRIDATIALALAALVAVRSPQQSSYITDLEKWNGKPDDQTARDNFQRMAKNQYLLSGGMIDIRRALW